MTRAKIVGIDLGTTNSCVAVADERGTRVLAGNNDERTIPSVVAFASEPPAVGHAAVRLAVTHPTTTIGGAKRLIGRKINAPEIERLTPTLPYELMAAPNGDAWIRLPSRALAPQEVSSLVLSKLKETAEAAMGETITRAVITVPAYFDDVQRQATRDAATLAGLEVVRLLNEPTAAALAYGVHRLGKTRRTVAVFDLGGGTFDITIMAVEHGIFEVLATDGDSALGGRDWDARIAEELMQTFRASHGEATLRDPVARARLLEAAEAAKIALSTESNTTVRLPHVVSGQTPLHLERDLTRKDVEAWTAALLDQLRKPCEAALLQANRSPATIDDVILVGGMSRWPAVERFVSDYFEKRPSRGVNPDEVVAMGAAHYAAVLAGTADDATLLDVTPRDIGVRIGGGRFVVLVPQNSMLPARARKVFATSQDNQQFVAIDLYQGDSETAEHNRRLGQVVLDQLPPGKAGTIRVELELTIDVESMISVSARELSTDRVAAATMRPAGGLSGQDLQEIMRRRQR